MFDAVFKRKVNEEGRREAMYALFAKAPEDVNKTDLEVIKTAVETDNAADPAGKDHRETSTALSLLLFLGDGRFPAAMAVVFPERKATAMAILGFRDFVEETKNRPEKGTESEFRAKAADVAAKLKAWPMLQRMVTQYTINALLRVKNFASVQEMVRELCQEITGMDPQTRKEITDLCNEFSGA